MPLTTMVCPNPDCKHKWNLPTPNVASSGFIRCPKCGIHCNDFEELYIGDILANGDEK